MFNFKQFAVDDGHSAMKVGTDGVLVGVLACGDSPRRILDVGAGSGLIALMLAQRYAEARVVAVECDSGSAADLRANIAASPWPSRMEAVEGDVFGLSLPAGSFDMIVCNPPFFTETLHSPDPRRAASRHESTLGVESLIRLSSRLLAPDGTLTFIAPYQRKGDIELMLSLAKLWPSAVIDVRQRADRPAVRSVFVSTRVNGPCRQSLLTISGENGYTTEFRKLTKDFYLNI